MTIEEINAVTLATHDMARAIRFYRLLGFEIAHGGADQWFTTFRAGRSYLNIIATPKEKTWSWWGRMIFHVDDVDAYYRRAVEAGLEPEAPPRNAEWGERYFHLTDPDGHELSFARPVERYAPGTLPE